MSPDRIDEVLAAASSPAVTGPSSRPLPGSPRLISRLHKACLVLARREQFGKPCAGMASRLASLGYDELFFLHGCVIEAILGKTKPAAAVTDGFWPRECPGGWRAFVVHDAVELPGARKPALKDRPALTTTSMRC